MNTTPIERKFLGASAAAAVAIPAKAQTADAPSKRVIYRNGKKPAKRMNSTVAYGNLIFISGVGYHEKGVNIKDFAHQGRPLDSIKAQLESAGSSMSKVLKCNVYLADLKDYDAMNEVYDGSFGDEPPARTTLAAAGIPGNSLIEIDVIACL